MVLVYPVVEPCSEVPIALRSIGSGSHARVLQAHSACLPTSGREGDDPPH
jgi:hypothetical protein